MKDTQKKPLEIGQNLAILIGVVVGIIGANVMLIGGCAVNGFFKMKAVEASGGTLEVKDADPAVGGWRVGEPESEVPQ